ncbi:hypothetical protein [Sphingomonas sp. PAMC 26621]|uniref:hypothetical protein n=1 Tax=Sphingomonas sp. PAMC 26621 TaxID=1112213 RepID=UPI00111119B2|nr:hypothetical protein [Sphingomonas sp. PAMC 26621]
MSEGVVDRPDIRPIFDAAWYARRQGLDGELAAWRHYAAEGGRGRLDPNPLFDSRWYNAAYPDSASVDAVSHFLATDNAQVLCPSPFFESDWYVANNPDVRDAGLNPYVHYIQWGRHEGRMPNRWCDPAYGGPETFDPDVRVDFVPEELVGYIPHYAVLAGLTSGLEASVFFAPRTPRWIFARVTMKEAPRDENAVLLGGARVRFYGDSVYDPNAEAGTAGCWRAYRVRYAVAPLITHAVTLLGHDLSSADAMTLGGEAVARTAASRPDVLTAQISLIVDAPFAAQLRQHLAHGPLAAVSVVAMEPGYLCRVRLL